MDRIKEIESSSSRAEAAKRLGITQRALRGWLFRRDLKIVEDTNLRVVKIEDTSLEYDEHRDDLEAEEVRNAGN